MKTYRYIEDFERLLLFPLFLLLLAVIFINANITYNSRQQVVIQNRGLEYNLQSVISPQGEITLRISGDKLYPQLQLMVNGEMVTSFNEEQQVSLRVKDGDLIQINASMYEEEIEVDVAQVSSNVKGSLLSKRVVTRGNIMVLSTIRLQ